MNNQKLVSNALSTEQTNHVKGGNFYQPRCPEIHPPFNPKRVVGVVKKVVKIVKRWF